MQVGESRTELDIRAIESILPHRYPFLMVDRMIELEGGVRGVGVKCVSANEYFFQGHYPSRPVMPGVLILEHIAQVGALVIASDYNIAGMTPLITGIEKARFRRMVVPGDKIVTEAEVLRSRRGIGSIRGVSRVDGEVAAEAEMSFLIRKVGGDE